MRYGERRRSHFRHRLAIVAADATGILRRLEAFLSDSPVDGVLTGETSGHNSDPSGRSQAEHTAGQIADLFVAGADVDWTRMYPRRSFRIADLPTYPFERERYWIDAPGTRAITPIVFEANVRTTSPAYLDHHRVFGAAVYPAAAFIELALAAGHSVLGRSGVALEDVEILRPLVLADTGMVTVRTALTPDSTGRYRFTIQSVGTGTEPVTHVSGRLTGSEAPLAASPDVATALNGCGDALDVARFYQEFAACGISFGEDFRAIRQLHRGTGRSVGGVRLSTGLLDDVAQYSLHPVLLDACFQSSIAAWPADGGSATYLPVSIERVDARPSTAAELWSVATARPAGSRGGGRVVDLDIVAASGLPIAKVTGLALRASNPATLFRSPDATAPEWSQWLYAPVWREAPRRPVARTARRWVVLTDQMGIGTRLAQRLEARGDAVIQIARGHREQLDRVASETGADPLQVIYLWSLDSGASVASGQSIPDAALEQCEHLLSILSAVAGAAGSPLAGLWLVTRGGQAAGSGAGITLEQSPLWGIDKVIALEHPGLGGACIDLDPSGDDDDARVIFDELSGAADRAGIAYRGGTRYEARLAPTPGGVVGSRHAVDSCRRHAT